MTEIEPDDLDLREQLLDAFGVEQCRLAEEIRVATERKRELAEISRAIRVVAARAYLLQCQSGDAAANEFAEAQAKGRSIVQRVRDIGCFALWAELNCRHVDQWVKLRPVPTGGARE